ncbi:RidA family protein [Pseudoxanthobacter sp.]|uniref:RidA family protein n=1 Tax=Pseudoxanthobacter sp. TaxID=1925742 RepID=UPI002FE0D512
MPISAFSSRHAPAPGGHYSQGTRANGLIFVSGQLPVSAAGTGDPGAPFADQARQALANVLAVVEAGGGSPGSIARLTVYLADIADWAAFDAVAAEVLGNARPARTVVPVAGLHHGYRVEIDAIAAAEWR